MWKQLQVPLPLLFCLLLLSCQKQPADVAHKPTTLSLASGTLWQSDAHELFTQQITTREKINHDSSITLRSRSFEKAYTFSGADCSGEEINLVGTVNYNTTDVYDLYGNEIGLKTHISLNGTGKTADGETFRVHEVAQENFNMSNAKAGGRFLFKERWRTARHGGTIVFALMGKFNSKTGNYDFHISSITYQCN